MTEPASDAQNEPTDNHLRHAAARAVAEGATWHTITKYDDILHGLSFNELLVQYVDVVRDHPGWPSRVRDVASQLVHHCAYALASDRDVLTSYALFCAAYPSDAVTVTADVFCRRRFDWSPKTLRSALPGLFNAQVYDSFDFFKRAPEPLTRTQYLQQRLAQRDMGITPQERTLALTLTQEWEGTMPELLVTAKALLSRGTCHASHRQPTRLVAPSL
jgi:hypothetical protein